MEIEKQVDFLLEQVGIRSSYKNRYQHEFSGGQRQRIAIARAMALETEIILLDEPVSALDMLIRGQILNLFRNLQKEKKVSCIYISHDIASVRYISDYTAVMYFGKIVEYGPTEVIFNNRIHPYTDALLKASVVTELNRDFEKDIIAGEVPTISNPPKGCPFHSRCKHCMDICRQYEPGALRVYEEDHYVSCHLYNDYVI